MKGYIAKPIMLSIPAIIMDIVVRFRLRILCPKIVDPQMAYADSTKRDPANRFKFYTDVIKVPCSKGLSSECDEECLSFLIPMVGLQLEIECDHPIKMPALFGWQHLLYQLVILDISYVCHIEPLSKNIIFYLS